MNKIISITKLGYCGIFRTANNFTEVQEYIDTLPKQDRAMATTIMMMSINTELRLLSENNLLNGNFSKPWKREHIS